MAGLSSPPGRIGLVTDSNSQITRELVERFGIEVVPLTVTIDGAEFSEGIDLDADEFYAHFDGVVNAYWFESPLVVFEVALGLWLLAKGLHPSGTVRPDEASGRAPGTGR